MLPMTLLNLICHAEITATWRGWLVANGNSLWFRACFRLVSGSLEGKPSKVWGKGTLTNHCFLCSFRIIPDLMISVDLQRNCFAPWSPGWGRTTEHHGQVIAVSPNMRSCWKSSTENRPTRAQHGPRMAQHIFQMTQYGGMRAQLGMNMAEYGPTYLGPLTKTFVLLGAPASGQKDKRNNPFPLTINPPQILNIIFRGIDFFQNIDRLNYVFGILLLVFGSENVPFK